MSKVVIAGLGYVGLPLAVRAAEVGHTVIGVDTDARKIEALRQSASYVEDVSDQRLDAVISSGAFIPEHAWSTEDETPTAAIGFDLAVITVPTPLKDLTPDLRYVVAAATSIATVIRRGAAVVLESTTYPGTTEGVLAQAITSVSGLQPGTDFHLGFSPERIDPGPTSPYTLENTPKLVSATTPEGLEVIDGFYSTIVETTVRVSSPRTAEMAKIFENTQAYLNIALSNELADICRLLDIDVHEMIEAALTKGHSVARWVPGPGVGGHCLPIDPLYLAWQTKTALGRPFRLAEVAHEINRSRPEGVVRRAQELLNDRGLPARDSNVVVLGLAYKPDVGDVRESPALEVVDGLRGLGARVTVVDPHVQGWTDTPVLSIEDLQSELSSFDLAIMVTDHSAFDTDKIGSLATQVLDCRHSFRPRSTVVPL